MRRRPSAEKAALQAAAVIGRIFWTGPVYELVGGMPDFELLTGHARHVTCSGTRAEEMALRLKYAGVDAPIAVERDLGRSLDAALAAGDGGPLFALPTYTALLELRDLLAARGVAGRWSD